MKALDHVYAANRSGPGTACCRRGNRRCPCRTLPLPCLPASIVRWPSRSNLRFEGPAIGADVDELAVIVLAPRRHHAKAGTNDQILLQPANSFSESAGAPKKLTDSQMRNWRIRLRFAVRFVPESAVPRAMIRHGRVELNRHPTDRAALWRTRTALEVLRSGWQWQLRTKGHATPRVRVACDQKVDADRGIGIGARLDVLRGHRQYDPRQHAGRKRRQDSFLQP